MSNWNLVDFVFENYVNLKDSIHYVINENLKYITEVAHVNYRMDSVSDTIMKYIDITDIDEILMNEYLSSTWYFDSYTLTCYSSFSEDYDEDTMHLILFKFVNTKNFKSAGYSYIEDRSVIMTPNDDIKIVINLYDYFYYSKTNNYTDETEKEELIETIKDTIQGSIDHELQHGFDEYLQPDKNWLDNEENSFSQDVKNNIHRFSYILTTPDEQWIKDMSYFLGKDEQRAHFKAMSRFIEKDLYRGKEKSNIFRAAKELESVYSKYSINYVIDIDFYIISILRTHQVKELSRMILFKEFVNEFKKNVVRGGSNNYSLRPLPMTLSKEPGITSIRAIILGYYMYKHGLLNFKSHKPVDVSKFFSEENINTIFDDSLSYVEVIDNIRNIEYIDDYINCVKASSFINYIRYEKLISNECERLLNIFSEKTKFDLVKDYERDTEYVPKYLWMLVAENVKGRRY